MQTSREELELIEQIVFRAVQKALEEALRSALSSLPTSYPRWLPSKEASRYSGLSEKTLRRLAQEGEIYATTIGGGKLLFDRESIDEFFLKQHREVRVKASAITKEILRSPH